MPENTFPAFDNAVRLGVDWLEFDIQMTADDQLVISHDGTVNATFCIADPGSGVDAGPIRAMKLSDVLKFDCGAEHRALYPTQQAAPGTHMPTLDAMLRRYRGSHAVLFGETKFPGPGEGKVDAIAFTKLVAAEIRKYGLEQQFILQSANLQSIDAMHEADPRVRTCILYPWLANTDYLLLAREHHASCMLLRLQDADATEVKRLRDAGIIVISDVIDDEKSWRDYLARGVDALFTNNPAALIAFLNRQGLRP
jgi:glycerophosphoryl diester phosphodiesterase